jgi:hypothetical protein
MYMRRISVTESDEGNEFNLTVFLSDENEQYDTRVTIEHINNVEFQEEIEESEQGPVRKYKWLFEYNEGDKVNVLYFLVILIGTQDNTIMSLVTENETQLQTVVEFVRDSEIVATINRVYTDIKDRLAAQSDMAQSDIVQTPPIQPGALNGGYTKSYFCRFK